MHPTSAIKADKTMPRLDDQIRSFIGMQTEIQLTADAVERGAVRRYAQAIMDVDPIYMDPPAGSRYQKPVAPPLFPNAMLRLPFGDPDLVTQRAEDPHFDGAVGSSTMGLPPLPLVGSPLLNGGTEVEMYRFAEHGEQVWLQSRYLDIYEKESSKGVMLMVVIETDFLDRDRKLIMRFRKTQIRR
ncbi:MAG: MaoC family dehydratase N-terminal domain-containing protein [Usitatibacter sp.]